MPVPECYPGRIPDCTCSIRFPWCLVSRFSRPCLHSDGTDFCLGREPLFWCCSRRVFLPFCVTSFKGSLSGHVLGNQRPTPSCFLCDLFFPDGPLGSGLVEKQATASAVAALLVLSWNYFDDVCLQSEKTEWKELSRTLSAFLWFQPMKYREPKRILADRDPKAFFETPAVPCQFGFLHPLCLTRVTSFPSKEFCPQPRVRGEVDKPLVLHLSQKCPALPRLLPSVLSTFYGTLRKFVETRLGTGLNGFVNPATKQANEKLLLVGDDPRFWVMGIGRGLVVIRESQEQKNRP